MQIIAIGGLHLAGNWGCVLFHSKNKGTCILPKWISICGIQGGSPLLRSDNLWTLKYCSFADLLEPKIPLYLAVRAWNWHMKRNCNWIVVAPKPYLYRAPISYTVIVVCSGGRTSKKVKHVERVVLIMNSLNKDSNIEKQQDSEQINWRIMDICVPAAAMNRTLTKEQDAVFGSTQGEIK